MAADPTLYRYKAVVDHVTDGDTVALTVDVGYCITVRQRCRLHQINVHEHDEPGGQEAMAFLKGLLSPGQKVIVRSVSADRYAGRFVGQLFLPDGRDVSTVMVDAGFAAPWNGQGAKPHAPWPRPADVEARYPMPTASAEEAA